MSMDISQIFWLLAVVAALLTTAGLYCILVTSNMIRMLIGVELLTKAVTLLLVLAGYITGRQALTQDLIITLIVIEVVVIAVGAGIIIGAHERNSSLNVTHLRDLKG